MVNDRNENNNSPKQTPKPAASKLNKVDKGFKEQRVAPVVEPQTDNEHFIPQTPEVVADLKFDNKKSNNFFHKLNNKELVNLQNQVNDLKVMLNERENLVADLQSQLEESHLAYQQKLEEKSFEAQKIINAKIEEYKWELQTKFSDERKYLFEKDGHQLVEIINQFENVLMSLVHDQKLVSYFNGFKMFLSMFHNFLSGIGITAIVVNPHDPFDETFMSAFETVPASDAFAPNTVVEVIKKGYRLHDRVLSYVVVKVSE